MAKHTVSDEGASLAEESKVVECDATTDVEELPPEDEVEDITTQSGGVPIDPQSAHLCPREHRCKKVQIFSNNKDQRHCSKCGERFAWVMLCPACKYQWCTKCYPEVTNDAERGRRTRKRRNPPKAVRDAVKRAAAAVAGKDDGVDA